MAAAEASAQPQWPCNLAPTGAATVAEAIDGVTVRAEDGTIVRLAGIEAPWPPLMQSDSLAWPPAETARRHLAGLTDGGATIHLVAVSEEPDRYGRVPAYAFLADGRWLQAELVAAGHARVRPGPEESACIGALLRLEDHARRARLGLWSDPEYAVRSAYDPSLSARNGLYEIVEGRVASVNRGKRMIFLDFGREYWRDFSVMVPAQAAARFVESGMPVDDLAGRRVRVRGVIEARGGPAVRVYDPIAIEVLGGNGTAGDPG